MQIANVPVRLACLAAVTHPPNPVPPSLSLSDVHVQVADGTMQFRAGSTRAAIRVVLPAVGHPNVPPLLMRPAVFKTGLRQNGKTKKGTEPVTALFLPEADSVASRYPPLDLVLDRKPAGKVRTAVVDAKVWAEFFNALVKLGDGGDEVPVGLRIDDSDHVIRVTLAKPFAGSVDGALSLLEKKS